VELDIRDEAYAAYALAVVLAPDPEGIRGQYSLPERATTALFSTDGGTIWTEVNSGLTI